MACMVQGSIAEVVNKGVHLFIVDKEISAKGSSRTKKSSKGSARTKNPARDQRGRRTVDRMHRSSMLLDSGPLWR